MGVKKSPLYWYLYLATYFIFLSTQLFPSVSGDNTSGPEVVVSNGLLKGRWQLSRNSSLSNSTARSFASFEGIPYAKPPKRFMPPEPTENSTEVLNATFTRTVCPQFEGINGVFHNTSEDCLFLNVYAPNFPLNSTNPVLLPTMFWIHGGGFMDGAGSFLGPKYMMERDVILVTINYRLGALGFLNTGDDLITGNMGLKDMIMALKWVQGNIQFFGGNPAAVTIFGESAGGAAVHSLMVSPAAKGLFHRVIAQSGTSLENWSLIEDHVDAAQNVAKELKCEISNATQMVECLKGKSIQEILEAQLKVSNSFGPTVDKNAHDFSVLPDAPINLMKNATTWNNNSLGVPVIIGFNKNEGFGTAASIMSNTERLKELNANFNGVISAYLGYSKFLDAPNTERVSSAIQDLYFNGSSSAITLANLQNLSNLFTDYQFFQEIKRTMILQGAVNDQVYNYELTYRGNFSLTDGSGLSLNGPSHADDLQYLFNSLLGPKQNWPDLIESSSDEELSVNLINLWTLFAHGGKPWTPISSAEIKNASDVTTVLKWYNLLPGAGADYVLESPDVTARLKFWETVFTEPETNSVSSLFSQSFSSWTALLPILIACLYNNH